MIPLRDSTRTKSFPIITVTLIVLNVIIFIYQISLSSEELTMLFYKFGVVPYIYTASEVSLLLNPLYILPLFTSIFLHGNLIHIIGNMLYLWVFGDNIEDKLGKMKYIFFYLSAGLIGNLAHIWSNPTSTVPTIGASGAIAGVLGAYFIAFPRAKVLALVPIGFFITVTTVPALLFLVLWFVLQLISGLTVVGAGQPVAWWAHIGGFVGGAILWRLLRPHKTKIHT